MNKNEVLFKFYHLFPTKIKQKIIKIISMCCDIANVLPKTFVNLGTSVYSKKMIKKQQYVFLLKFHHEVHKGLELMIFEWSRVCSLFIEITTPHEKRNIKFSPTLKSQNDKYETFTLWVYSEYTMVCFWLLMGLLFLKGEGRVKYCLIMHFLHYVIILMQI